MKVSKEVLPGGSTDGNYRYPGSRPFNDTEVDRCLFFGRDKEAQLLLHKTLNWGLVVLYAKSGSGKTSLINAGLNQELRDRGYMPITVRLNNPDVGPMQAFFQGIKDFAAQKDLDYEHGEEDSLWQFFKTTYFWESIDKRLKPVLILDQFEEFFISYSREKRKTFIQNLADLVNNTVPGELLAAIPPGQQLPYRLDAPGAKIIISIREDFLGQLEEMSEHIPAILSDRFRLMPLTREQARQAIMEPSQVKHEAIRVESFKFTTEAVDMMLDFLCEKKEKYDFSKADEVEPFQLQILCRHMEEKSREKFKRMEDGVTIGKKDLGGKKGMQKILQQFYEDQLRKLDSFIKRKRTRKLFEKGLISIEDRRLSLEEGEIIRMYRVSKILLSELLHNRLLRSEPRLGSLYYELSHDTMVSPIRESQKKRQAKRKKIGFGFLLIFIFIIGLSWQHIEKQIVEGISMINFLIRGKDSIFKNLYENAQKLRTAGNNKEAITIYDKILKIDKTEVNAYLEKGAIFYIAEEYGQVISTYKKAIDYGIKDELIYYQLGKAYFKNGQPKEAIESYMEALAIHPSSPFVYEALGDVYRSQQQSKAIENYKKVLEIDKKKSVVYKKLARSYISIETPKNAIETFKKALKVNPGYAHIYEDISKALKTKGRIDLVEEIYDIVYRSNSKDASLYTSLGRNYQELKNYERSIDSFKKAIEIDPEYAYSYSNLGTVFSKLGNYTAAVKEFKKAIELNPNRVNTYNIMGYPLLRQGKYDEAIEVYKKALKISPGNIPTKMNLMEAYFVAKRFDKALSLTNELLKEEGMRVEYVLALRFITISSLLFQGKHQDAFTLTKEFIKYYGANKNYKRTWKYNVIKYFLEGNSTLPQQQTKMLLVIIEILNSPEKSSEKIKYLESLIQEAFKILE